MTRREMLDRMAALGAGLALGGGTSMAMSPFRRTAMGGAGQVDQPAPLERLLAQAEPAADQGEKVKKLEPMGYVVVTPNGPDDGGHFGQHSPGTRTSGLQEAFDHAKKMKRDVYLVGGAGYRLDETLRIPWRQNWRLDAGECFIWYPGKTGDAVVIDSQMNCWMKFGGIVSASDGAVVRLKPESIGPDNFCTWNANLLEFNVIVGAGNVMGDPGAKQKGIGLWFDASKGPIHSNQFFAIEFNACDKGIYTTGNGILNNFLQVPFLHLCHTAIQLGTPEAPNVNSNWIEAFITGIRPDSVGLDIFGQRNTFMVNFAENSPGKDIVFEAEARDNLVIAQSLPSGITNHAKNPTNRIITASPIGYGVETPPLPASGEDAVNRNPHPVQITILTEGRVSDYTETDAAGKSQTVSGGLPRGQRFILEPGEKVRFTYSAAPIWKWKALS